MDQNAKGRTIAETPRRVEPIKLGELETALGTGTAAQTATLVPFFSPTIAGEGPLVEALGMDLSRALLVGQSYRWVRPFREGEDIEVRLYVEDVFLKGGNAFAVVVGEFKDASGELIQEQRTTFIERGAQ